MCYRPIVAVLFFLHGWWALAVQVAIAASWIREGPSSLSSDLDRSTGPFELKVVRCDDSHLTGLAVLSRYSTRRDYKGETVTITGVETADGRFWPNVTLEVSDQIAGQWQRIPSVAINGATALRRISPHTLGAAFFVNLDPFSRFIGRGRYGRLLLENGDDVIFDLHTLEAPVDLEVAHEQKSWSREPDKLYPSPSSRPFITPPGKDIPRLSLLAVSFKDNHLVGEFPYGLNIEKEDVLKAAGSEEENSWPTVKAEVSNDGENGWKTIGESSKPDRLYKPTVPPRSAAFLHVDLEIFKPFIGMFRYGRVTLENGDSATFELVNLLRPEK